MSLERRLARFFALPTTLFIAATLNAAPPIIYNSIPTPLAPNYSSVGYDVSGTSEFGDLIQFAGTTRTLTTVTVVMSDWAVASDFGSAAPSWSHPITLNLYNVDNTTATPQPGTLIATKTQTFTIPWRPPADPTCATNTDWRAGDGNCYGGIGFTITFDMTGTVVPNQIIYGIAYNTHTHGVAPMGSVGPWDALNVATPANPPNPTVGTNPLPDTKYWNTTNAAFYTDGGAGGVGTFRQDTGWGPETLGAEFLTADADLAVVKTAPASAAPGANITYTLTATNNGASDAATVSLTDPLPAGTTFVSEVQNSGPAFGCINPAAGVNGTINCSIGTLATGATATFTVIVHIGSAVANGTVLSNTATLTSATTDTVPGNNSSTATTTMNNTTDLSVVKTAPPSAPAGATVTYSITVTNAGAADAQTVSLTDATPAGTTFLSAVQGTGPAFLCTKPAVGATGTVNCTIPTLVAGAVATFTIVDSVSGSTPTGSVLSNTATVSTTNVDSNAANNTSTATTSVAAFVPALGTFGLIALAMGLAMLATLRLRS